MPAALDLTGQRFGRLFVVRENGRVKFGKEQPGWLVECNCGRRETLAQALLTQRGWRECSYCQRPECIVCGKRYRRPARGASHALTPRHKAKRRARTSNVTTGVQLTLSSISRGISAWLNAWPTILT